MARRLRQAGLAREQLAAGLRRKQARAAWRQLAKEAKGAGTAGR